MRGYGSVSRRFSFEAGPAGQVAATLVNRQRQLYHGTRGEDIRIYDEGRARFVTVGTLFPDNVFVKPVKVENLLRTPPAIAVQAAAVETLARKGCVSVRAEISDGRVLVASFADFQRYALFLNRGFGEQWALPLSRWQSPDTVTGSLFGEEGLL